MLKENLSQSLKNERKKQGLTQESAAELCNLNPRFWGKMEQKKASASIDTLEKISTGLHIKVEDLLRGGEATDDNEK